MKTPVIDTVLLRAPEGLSRRASLAGLGGAALAAFSLGAMTEAKNGKKRNKKDKDAQRCLRQNEQCLAAVVAACDERPQPLACRNRFLDCCEPFADCSAERAVACFFFGVLP